MSMNKLERHTLNKWAAKNIGDRVDWRSHIDPTLSYWENKEILLRFRTRTARRKAAARVSKVERKQRIVESDIQQAHFRHSERSPRAIQQDERQRHRRVINPHKKAIPASWFRRPGSSDIKGIDAPASITKKRKTKKRSVPKKKTTKRKPKAKTRSRTKSGAFRKKRKDAGKKRNK